jgi:TfoX/Sxy family transcriptional regulator of competence genes
MYERDGQSAERILFNFIRCRWYFPSKRLYVTENFYSIIETEGKRLDIQEQEANQAAAQGAKKPGDKAKGKAPN